MLLDLLKQTLHALWARANRRANRLTGGVFGIVVTGARRFLHSRATEAAAGMAYYALFSLFPLLIFLVALGSFVLETNQVRQQVVVWLVNLFPTAADLIEHNLELVITRRGPAGATAIVGLLWAGSGAFNALARNINRAWPNARPRNFLSGRLVALAMIVALALLLFLSLFAGTLAGLMPFLNGGGVWDGASRLATGLSTVLFPFAMFVVLYRWVPNARVTWVEAGWGAVVATIGWRGGIAAFTWYLSSGLANYQLVYGTLGTVIALMFWIYLSSLITLFGAHLSAAVALHRRLAQAGE
ncbi:MAG: YihY/virulence factor BrkB family protein [Anaerolineae bacterium]